jgi:hypothetical protein
MGANNPDDPSQCCADRWVPRFQDGGTYSMGVRALEIVAIALGDLNQDGRTDLVASFVEIGVDRPSPQLGVLIAQPDGTFAPPVSYPICSSTGLAVGDLNGDGFPDVVLGTCADSSIEVFMNSADGTGSLLPGAELSYQTLPEGSSFPLVDFDGDGKLDLVLGGAEAYLLRGLGDGGFADPVGYPFPVPPAGEYAIVAASFHTGGSDFVVGTRSNAALSVFLDQGNGSFVAQSTIWNGFSSLGLAAGDFDGDGHTDIALGGSDTGEPMSILLGKGDGTFSGQNPYPAAGIGRVALSDVDRDGRCEALVAASNPSPAFNVLWHFADGGTLATTIPLDQSPDCLTVGDLNEDAAPDVAIGMGSAIQLFTSACRADFKAPTR